MWLNDHGFWMLLKDDGRSPSQRDWSRSTGRSMIDRLRLWETKGTFTRSGGRNIHKQHWLEICAIFEILHRGPRNRECDNYLSAHVQLGPGFDRINQ